MHGPSTAPRGPTAARAGRSSHGELTWRPAPRVGWVATRRSRTGSGGPETPRDTSVVVANGRLVVIFSLVGRLDWNKGQRGPCGVHADDCAAWFVSIGPWWGERGVSAQCRATRPMADGRVISIAR